MATNGALDRREDRYGPAFVGERCEEFVVSPQGGEVLVEAHMRQEGGSPRARAEARVSLVAAPAAVCPTGTVRNASGIIPRAPVAAGWACYGVPIRGR